MSSALIGSVFTIAVLGEHVGTGVLVGIAVLVLVQLATRLLPMLRRVRSADGSPVAAPALRN